MVLPTIPEWLKKRNGSLVSGIRPEIVFVVLNGQPQYRLDVRPAHNQFTCNITQTNNGRRLDDDARFPTDSAALTGGLETLRNKLGW